MMISKRVLFFVLCLFMLTSSSFSTVFNGQGDFSVEILNQKDDVFNDDIEGEFKFIITNNLHRSQNIDINLDDIKGWDLELSDTSFSLKSLESIEVELKYVANSDFDYSTDVVSPEEIKISQINDYIGTFDFPLTIVSQLGEEVSVSFEVFIDKREKTDYVFEPKFASSSLSPNSPLGFTINSENLDKKVFQDLVHIIMNIIQTI